MDLKSLTPAQQAAGLFGGLALVVVVATPFLFDGASIPGFSSKSRSAEAAKKAAEGELFARKGGAAPAATAENGFSSPASSPFPKAGEALASAARGPGRLPMDGARSGAARGGAGGPIGAQGVVNMGGGRAPGAGPAGTLPGGYTTAGATAKAGTARSSGPDGGPSGAGASGGETYGEAADAGEAGPDSPGRKPPMEPAGRDIARHGEEEQERGAVDPQESGKLPGFNPFKSDGLGGGGDEEDDCTSQEAKNYDAQIEARIRLYTDLVMERQDRGCRGIYCGRFSAYCNHASAIVRSRYAHHCRCDRLACRQQKACSEGHRLNCARDRACGQETAGNCADKTCELDPY